MKDRKHHHFHETKFLPRLDHELDNYEGKKSYIWETNVVRLLEQGSMENKEDWYPYAESIINP